MFTTSPEGLAFLKAREGCRLESYKDTVGVWTIGYGHTGELDGTELGPGLKISQQYADQLLSKRLKDEFEPCVNNSIKTPLTQHQFDALVSFCYNIGTGAFSKSTMVKKINLRDYAGAANEFDKWHKPVEITGRRDKEKDLFLGIASL